MNMPLKTVRVILISFFILMTVGGILTSIYAIGLTAFGVGWAGGEKSFFEIIWGWKGLLLLTIYSVIASYGLIKRKKTGIVFGMPIALSILTYSIFDFGISIKYGDSLKFGDLTSGLLFLTLSILILIGLYKIMKHIGYLSKRQYLIGVILTLFVILSFKFMFD